MKRQKSTAMSTFSSLYKRRFSLFRYVPGVYAELSIIRRFFESTNELIAKSLVTSHQSIIVFAVSSGGEECGREISDEPHLTFCSPCSKNAWRSLMVRTPFILILILKVCAVAFEAL